MNTPLTYFILIAILVMLAGTLILISRRLDSFRKRSELGEERLASFIELAVDGIFIGDASGNLIGVNSRACELTGYPRDALLSKNMRDLFSEDHLQQKPLRYDLLKLGKTIVNERIINRPDGTQVVVEMHSKRLPDGTHQSFMRDITERKRAEEVIRQLNESLSQLVEVRTSELDRSNRELAELCYAISHELRAPIARIQGMCDALREDCNACPGKTPQLYSGRIIAASRQLQRVIDGILHLERLSRAELKRETVDFTALVHKVASELIAAGAEREVSLQVAPDLQVTADPQMLQVCLENLLANALKFSAFSRSSVIKVGHQIQEGRNIYFVSDNGAGFDMAYADKLFIPFQRLHGQEEFPGIGIGLAMVKRVVERHNGRVWANALPEHGATFFFSLGEEPVNECAAS